LFCKGGKLLQKARPTKAGEVFFRLFADADAISRQDSR